MTWRPGAVVAARVLHATFFVGMSVYCLLSFVPFAYVHFIAPSVLPELTDFVNLSPWLFWVVLLLTILTLMPQLRGAKGQNAARGYVVVGVVTSIWFMWRKPLPGIGAGGYALIGGLFALLPPISLAFVDHVSIPGPAIRPVDEPRLLATSAWSAVVAWAIYAGIVPFRLQQVIGIDLRPAMLAVAFAWSLMFDAFVFAGIFLALLLAIRIVRLWRGPARVEYWFFVALLAVFSTVVLYTLVCASLAFSGRDAWLASVALGTTIAIVWADLVRVSIQARADRTFDSLSAFTGFITGGGSRVWAPIVLVALPVIAYALLAGVFQFDWNFLLQKLSVLAVWLVAFAAIDAVLAGRRSRQRTVALAAWPLLAFVAYAGLMRLEGRVDTVLDRYAAVDPSFRLIRDARAARSDETARYYAFLQANTLLIASNLRPVPLDFAPPPRVMPRQRLNIFLFVIDSLRRDYVSPYNHNVTFTPEIAKLAADSFVFDRAFTRYSGTALSVPAIWSGGMVAHTIVQPLFDRRNTLAKLVDGLGYQRVMVMDPIVNELKIGEPDDVQIERGKPDIELDVCDAVGELEERLPEVPAGRPVFFYALPQSVHIAVAARRKVPAGESYPGFFPPVASSVRRADGCLGRFVAFLKRAGRYDNSIIIVTADHGDSLGEEGRWGHAYFLFPEVMRVPLIIHLPPSMRARVATDLAAVSFSTDISPTLYALLGDNPADLGPLYGRPLFTSLDRDLSERRGPFLVASSYGAVYGVVRDNGRQMYVVDAVDSHEYAFDLTRPGSGERLTVTADMTATSRRLIKEQLLALGVPFGVSRVDDGTSGP